MARIPSIATPQATTQNHPQSSEPGMGMPILFNATTSAHPTIPPTYIATRPVTSMEAQLITAALCNSVSEQTIKILQLEGTLRALSQDNQTLQAKNDGLSSKNTGLEVELEELKGHLITAVKSNQAMRTENAQLKRALSLDSSSSNDQTAEFNPAKRQKS